jgi:aminopeptidase
MSCLFKTYKYQRRLKNIMKRLKKYAETMIKLIDIKKGERVWLQAPAESKELILEIQKQLLTIGAFVDLDVYIEEASFNNLYYSSAENLNVYPPSTKSLVDTCDKHITIWCKNDYVVDYSKIPAENLKASRAASRDNARRLDEVPGVGGYYPTPHLAKDAGMEWEEYLDFFFDAVTVDLFALYNEFRWLEEIINRGNKIRITGYKTDLTMDITGRKCCADETFYWNVPDGELFTSPVETETSGHIFFDEPLIYRDSVTVKDLYLEFENGKVSKFKASEGEKFFGDLLDTDEGAKIPGEIGIGINPKIDRMTKNDVFDEKIIGTIHLALGNGFVEAGSKNISGIHWDLIKNLRNNGKIYIDDRLVSDSGKWVK